MKPDQLVDAYRNWEASHNRDNYGRYDAYNAGYQLAAQEYNSRMAKMVEALDCIASLEQKDAEYRSYWFDCDIETVLTIFTGDIKLARKVLAEYKRG